MTHVTTSLARARAYLAAIERGTVGEELAAFFAPDVVQEEFPNRLFPRGMTRHLPQILDSARRGQEILQKQHYEVLHAITDGAHIALEVQWTGTLSVAIGGIAAGGEMRDRFALFLEFRDGKIARQRNYDCFDPW